MSDEIKLEVCSLNFLRFLVESGVLNDRFSEIGAVYFNEINCVSETYVCFAINKLLPRQIVGVLVFDPNVVFNLRYVSVCETERRKGIAMKMLDYALTHPLSVLTKVIEMQSGSNAGNAFGAALAGRRIEKCGEQIHIDYKPAPFFG